MSNLLALAAGAYAVYYLGLDDNMKTNNRNKAVYRRVPRDMEDAGIFTHIPRYYHAGYTGPDIHLRDGGSLRLTQEEYVMRPYTSFIATAFQNECA